MIALCWYLLLGNVRSKRLVLLNKLNVHTRTKDVSVCVVDNRMALSLCCAFTCVNHDINKCRYFRAVNSILLRPFVRVLNQKAQDSSRTSEAFFTDETSQSTNRRLRETGNVNILDIIHRIRRPSCFKTRRFRDWICLRPQVN
jgi:hypothetical protein